MPPRKKKARVFSSPEGDSSSMAHPSSSSRKKKAPVLSSTESDSSPEREPSTSRKRKKAPVLSSPEGDSSTMAHPSSSSRKKKAPVLSSTESDSSPEREPSTSRKRKKAPVLSSTESDSSPEREPSSSSRRNIQNEAEMEPQSSHTSGYDSDGKSSVECLDIIMYPSTSVLREIQEWKSSKESEKLEDVRKMSLPGKSTKSKDKQPNKKTTCKKSVQKNSENLSKLSTSSSKVKRKNEVKSDCVNDAYSNKTINKSSTPTTKKNKNPNFSQRTEQEKENACKKPHLNQFVLNEVEKSLSKKYEESNTATCSYFPENIPNDNQTKKSSVKKRPENFGSRLNPFLRDLEATKSHVNNKRRSSDESKQTPIKLKKKWHNKYQKSEENSKTNICDQSSKSHYSKNISYSETSLEVHKQPSAETFSEELNNRDKVDRAPQKGIRSNSKHSNSDRQFHETISEPCNSLESLQSLQNQSDVLRTNISFNYSLYLIKTIVHLDTKWLEEREKIQKPPSELGIREFKNLPLFFDSFQDYFHTYSSMLKAEVWEKICSSTKYNVSHTSKNNFTFSVDTYDYDFGLEGLMRFNCKSEVDNFTENSLVIVGLKLEDGQHKSAFGIIGQLEYTNKHVSETDKRHDESSAKQLVFKMFVKGRVSPPKKNCQMEGKFVCSLYKETKLAEALYLMRDSPFLKDFLKPNWDTFYVSHNEYNGDFFDVQQNIYKVVSQEMNLLPSKHKIMLLQGPPGSGKTSAIVTIASKLLRNKDVSKKILIVAPSHVALDVIGKQLLEQEELFINPINFVRLGHIKNIHQTLWEHSLPKYLEKYRMFHKMNGRSQNHTDHYLIAEILNDIPIILAVPEDCWELYEFKLEFFCCLIDEVNQGTELDILYPFTLGIKKFLLVADHMMLPASVESETARNSGFHRSVMERFQSCIITNYDNDPSIVLHQQFRFNSNIADFPFNYIYRYSDYSEKCSYAEHRSTFYPFKSYVALDDHRPCESDTQENGINVITSLCSFIISKYTPVSIGIIVPSEVERRAYMAAIVGISSSIIEVNTVDRFQGHEKTVIILSCYHDFKKEIPFRTDYFRDFRKLNVALTRATHSLMICGPLHATLKYKLWSNIVTYFKNLRSYFKFESPDEVRNLIHI